MHYCGGVIAHEKNYFFRKYLIS